MNNDFNIYDVPVLNNSIKELEKFQITTKTKKEHETKVYQLQSLINEIQSKTHVPTIHTDYNYYFDRYKKGVVIEKTTKKNSDHNLKMVIFETIKQIRLCIDVEHQTFDGRLIPDPKNFSSWIEPNQLQKRIDYEATR